MAPKSVYVGGMYEDIKKEDLEREFSRFGKLTKVWVAHNPPGFAFIDFQNEKDAKEAIKEMNGAIINTCKIRVNASHSGRKKGRKLSSRGDGFCGGHCGRVGFGKRQDRNFNSGYRHRKRDFLQRDPRYRAGDYDGGSVYHIRSPISQSSHFAWKPVGVLDCPELIRACEDSSKCESSGKKRKLSGAENVSSECVKKKKAYAKELNDSVMNINCLPEEILIKIFRYLRLSELGCIARVCRWWYKITSAPILWKKIDLKMFQRFQRFESQDKVASSLVENLPSCVTHLRLDFNDVLWCYALPFLPEALGEFEKFCIKLKKRCPSLKVLILHHKEFSISLQSVVDLCMQYMQNLEILSVHYCYFRSYSLKIDVDHCKIKVLDLHSNNGLYIYSDLTLSKMPSLKKLILSGSEVNDYWFQHDISFLDNLEVLNLQSACINSNTFQMLKNRALNLTELYICTAYVQNRDFRFSNSVFPQLKTVCLRCCHNVTCEGLVSLIRSCQSLQNVYVDRKIAASYVQHPLIVANKCKLQIVKSSEVCHHYVKDYLYEE